MKFTTLTVLLIISTCLTKRPRGTSKKYKNICYDGQDPTHWSQKQKLTEFAKGPCSPLLIAPGIGGSNLEVQIDCVTLQEKSPETFKACGWSSCMTPSENASSSEKNSTPKSEYQIWVPAPFSPMSVLTPLEKNKDCFSALVGTDYDTSTGKVVYKPRPGVKIKPLGATPLTKTKKEGNCAFDGVEHLIPDIPNPETTAYLVHFRKRLEYMGYESGLTVQALPYDFRHPNGLDDLSKNYGNIVKQMFELVNKKVTVLAHSMGNFRTSYMLWNMDQADKDKYISNYIAMAPPYLGASKAMLFLTCGSEQYTFPLHVGLDYKTFSHSIATFASMWQLIPHDAFYTQRSSDWMQTILKRIAYEKGESDDPVFDFFPKREEICYPKFPSRKNCRSGLIDYSSFGTTKDGEQITAENFKEMMSKLSPSPEIENLWIVRDDRYNTMVNFGVPMTLVYGNSVETIEKFNFKVNPKEYVTEHNKFCDEKNKGFNIENTMGDGTVPSPSAVTFGAKMALDFKMKKPNAKPVTFVDVCSEFNASGTPYQKVKENGEKVFEDNGYVGLPCDCKEGKIKHCTHNGMMWLPEMMDFLSETLNYGVRGNLSPEMQAKDEAYFDDWVDNCRLFVGNIMGKEEDIVEE